MYSSSLELAGAEYRMSFEHADMETKSYSSRHPDSREVLVLRERETNHKSRVVGAVVRSHSQRASRVFRAPSRMSGPHLINDL